VPTGEPRAPAGGWTQLYSDEAVEAPAKVPFWKREISFRRKSKAEENAPVAEEAGEKADVPFYKREISFRRKPKARAQVARPAAEAGAAPGAAPQPPPVTKENVPFYKREISFKRKPRPVAAIQPDTPPVAPATEASAEAEPAAPVEGAEASAAPAVVQSAVPKVPFYKREISVGRKRGAVATSSTRSIGRQKSLVGVKIGASGISAARVSQSNDQIELLDLVREPLPRGVIVAGEVRDVDALASGLARLFAQNRLPKKAVRLGISNNRIGVRIIEISGVMDPKQLENAIRFRAQEVLPIALEDAVLDYQQLSETVNAEGELVRRILLVVAYRDLIDRYVVAFKEAGVRLVGIDLEAFGLLRALTPPAVEQERADAAHVVVSIGHERSTFAVSDGRICEFTRVLEWGGSTLDVAIARQLNLAPSEAEPIKHALALDDSQRPLPPNVSEEQVALAADIVRRQLQTFARELVSSLQYYQNQPGSLGIGDIVITGGTSLLPGLASELQRLIGVSVRVGDPYERVRVSKAVSSEEQLRALSVAIGLAIED
jgi:type IV pilus assembly protein PilM